MSADNVPPTLRAEQNLATLSISNRLRLVYRAAEYGMRWRTAGLDSSATQATATTDLVPAALSLRFPAPIRDQLINQALTWGHVGKQAAKP